MAEINQEVTTERPQQQTKQTRSLDMDEEADPVADYMEVRHGSLEATVLFTAAASNSHMTRVDCAQARRQNKASAAAAAYAASGKAANSNEDEEVYAVAEAVDGLDDIDEDNFSALAADKKRIDSLPPLDHANIEYDGFAKDFYDEAPAVAKLTPSEVSKRSAWLGSFCQPEQPCSTHLGCSLIAAKRLDTALH